MPSEYESWGRVGVEAMASGIPVIAHPTPGLQESLGDAGVFVDRNDIDGWERAIRRLLTPRAYGTASKKARRGRRSWIRRRIWSGGWRPRRWSRRSVTGCACSPG